MSAKLPNLLPDWPAAPLLNEGMNAILGQRDWEAWLDPDMSNPQLLETMLRPCPDEWLERSPV